MNGLDYITETYERYTNAFLSLPTSVWERLFSGILLVYFVALVALTLTYPSADQRFPLVTGVGTLLLLILVFSSKQFGVVERFLDQFEGIDMMGGKDLQEQIGQSRDADVRIEEQRRRSLHTFGWLLVAFTFTLVSGILPGILLFMLLYYRWWAGFSWQRTITYSGVVWMFIYVTFDVLLAVRFWGGVLELLGLEIVLPF